MGRPATTVWAYLYALIPRVFVSMSGPLTVPFAVLALYVDNAWLKALFGVLAMICVLFAGYLVWRHERMRANRSDDRVEALEVKLRPGLVFAMGDCCINEGSVRIGVQNPSPISVRAARVYMTIPTLGIQGIILSWSSAKEDGEPIDVHHGPHFHTGLIAGVYTDPGGFWIWSGRDYRQVDAGLYSIALVAKGADIHCAEARMEVVFTAPSSITARLL